MKDFFWNLFEKSGNIDFYLAYKKQSDTGEADYEFGKYTGNSDT